MNTARAILGGSLLASLVTTVLLALLNLATASAFSPDTGPAFLAWFGLSWVATLVVAPTAGLAWHVFAQSRGWTKAHHYWLPALIVGVIPGAALVLWPALQAGSFFVWGVLSLYGGALGGLTGLFAWLIRRPDRDAANPPTSPP